MVLGNSLFFQAFGEEEGYQPAKKPLEAVTVRAVPLQVAPSPSSTPAMHLKPASRIRVLGRTPGWFRVEVPSDGTVQTGWLPAGALKIQAVAKPIPKMEPPAPPSAAKGKRSWPVRLGGRAGYAVGLKNLPDQFRVGGDLAFGLWPGADVGFQVDAGFREMLLLSFAPAFRHRLPWPKIGALRPSVYGGLPFYFISDGGREDFRFGVRFGVQFSYKWLCLGVGSDVMFVGADRVAVPLVSFLGVLFSF
jgi:hypothetical protein